MPYSYIWENDRTVVQLMDAVHGSIIAQLLPDYVHSYGYRTTQPLYLVLRPMP